MIKPLSNAQKEAVKAKLNTLTPEQQAKITPEQRAELKQMLLNPSTEDRTVNKAKEVGKAALEGSGLAGAGRLLTLQSGKNVDGLANKAGAVASDVADTAMLPVQGIKGLLMGALTGAGLDLSGANEVIYNVSKAIQEGGDFKKYLPDKLKQSTLANMLAQMPGGVASTLFEVAPMALGLEAGKKVSKKNPIVKKTDVVLSDIAKRAMDKGAEVSMSAEAMKNTKFAEQMGKEKILGQEKAIETQGTMQGREQLKNRANFLWKELSNVTEGLGEIDASLLGRDLQEKIKAFKPEEGKLFAETVKPIIEGKIKGDIAKTVSGNLASKLAELEFDKAELRGRTLEEIKSVKELSDVLARAKDLKDLWGIRQWYDKKIKGDFKDIGDSRSFLSKTMRDVINKTIEDTIPSKAKREVWKKANERYSIMADALDEMSDLVVKSPEKINEASLRSLDTVNAVIEAGGGEKLKANAIKYLISRSVKDGNVNVESLKREINKRPEVFKAALGDNYKPLKDYIELGDFLEGGLKYGKVAGESNTANKWANMLRLSSGIGKDIIGIKQIIEMLEPKSIKMINPKNRPYKVSVPGIVSGIGGTKTGLISGGVTGTKNAVEEEKK